MGRGGLLQLLRTASSPCCRSYPAGVVNRISQPTIDHAAFVLRERTRPPEFSTLRGHLCVHFRYGPATRSPPSKMALSMGFRPWVSRRSAIQATGRLTFTQVGLTPTDDISLRWTHSRNIDSSSSLFVDPSADDFRLANGSGAIDLYSSCQRVKTDIQGHARPVD